MRNIKVLRGPALTLITMLMAGFAVGERAKAQTEKDPHRPPCTSVRCRKIKSFLKKHYCGESPSGNGPDDGCDIKFPIKPGPGVDVKADFKCEWNTSRDASECHQHGQPSSEVREILLQHLRQLGLPTKTSGGIYFTFLESNQAGWSVAEAYYSHSVGSELDLCQVIVLIDKSSHEFVLRRLPFQKTDSDMVTVTQWSLVDLADVEGDGQIDVILEADACENHWLEVISVADGSPKAIFSGLGYYL